MMMQTSCLSAGTAEDSARIRDTDADQKSLRPPAASLLRHSRRTLVTATLLFLFALAGCSGKQPPADTSPLARPVTLLSDAAETSKKFQQLFAAGAAPKEKERRKYVEFMYRVSEVHPLTESEGELLVKVLDGSGQERGEATWTVVLEEGKWKLKSAPLP